MMTYEEARDEALNTFGTLDWSQEQGFFVTGGHPGARLASWWEEMGGGYSGGFGGERNWIVLPSGEIIDAPVEVSWAAQQQLAGLGFPPVPEGFRAIPGSPEEAGAAQDEELYELYQAQGGTLPWEDWLVDKPAFPSADEFQPAVDWEIRTDPNTGIDVVVGLDDAGNVVSYDPYGYGQQEPSQWEQDWRQQQQEFEAGQQTELIDWYREQQQNQLEADRQQRLAELAAQPISWLQYAAESGEPPVIQPWMMPLMPEQYDLGIGDIIPGFPGDGGGGGAPPGGGGGGLPPTATPPGEVAGVGPPPNYPFETLPMPPTTEPIPGMPEGYPPTTAGDIFGGEVPPGFNPESIYNQIPPDVLAQLGGEYQGMDEPFPSNLQYLQGEYTPHVEQLPGGRTRSWYENVMAPSGPPPMPSEAPDTPSYDVAGLAALQGETITSPGQESMQALQAALAGTEGLPANFGWVPDVLQEQQRTGDYWTLRGIDPGDPGYGGINIPQGSYVDPYNFTPMLPDAVAPPLGGIPANWKRPRGQQAGIQPEFKPWWG